MQTTIDAKQLRDLTDRIDRLDQGFEVLRMLAQADDSRETTALNYVYMSLHDDLMRVRSLVVEDLLAGVQVEEGAA